MAKDEEFHLWHYTPSLVLAVLSLILFGASAILHIYQVIKYRQKFWIGFVIGTLLQVIGYAARIGCTRDLNNLTIYIVQSLAVLLAPIFYAASIYSLLGKIIQYIGADDLSPIRPTRITCIFVIGDLISFFLQGLGGGMLTSSDVSKANLGSHIVLIGLIIQLIFFFFFIFLTWVFHARTRDWGVEAEEGDWRRLLKALEISSVLIFIRSMYRVIEYAQGFTGYLITHEVYLYVFDALMMLLVQLLFNVVHPGHVFNPEEADTKDIEMAVPQKKNKTKYEVRRNY